MGKNIVRQNNGKKRNWDDLWKKMRSKKLFWQNNMCDHWNWTTFGRLSQSIFDVIHIFMWRFWRVSKPWSKHVTNGQQQSKTNRVLSILWITANKFIVVPRPKFDLIPSLLAKSQPAVAIISRIVIVFCAPSDSIVVFHSTCRNFNCYVSGFRNLCTF